MNQTKGDFHAAMKAWQRAPGRALLLGPLCATLGGLFGAGCGLLLCLFDQQPLAFAGWWGLRGAAAGLVAGIIMGAISGIYHVEEPAPRPQAPSANGAAPAPRPVVLRRNGVLRKS